MHGYDVWHWARQSRHPSMWTPHPQIQTIHRQAETLAENSQMLGNTGRDVDVPT